MPETSKLILNDNQTEIVKAILYFDLFDYPLTLDELFENSAITISKQSFLKELNNLIDSGILKHNGDFILSSKSSEYAISKRIKGNEGAKKIMPTAYKYSRKIASYPFVEGVFLSGALSKKYYDENGDIDFFIVTKPNRLWICRTLLILRYKLLPKNKKKFWCTNYFISSDDLAIPDVNVFTGTELAYLIPTVNFEMYKRMLTSNSWYKSRFPNKEEAKQQNCIDKPKNKLSSFIELLLKGRPGKWLDDALLYITLKHWQNKYPEMSPEDFELQFRSRKNVCKRHTKGFQNKIIKIWDEKQREYEATFNVLLK
jgi:hypothetical protein